MVLGFALSFWNPSLLQKQAVNEIVKCNDFSAQFGLRLTEQQAAELTQTRAFALQKNGRIELGGGIIEKMIRAFCDSPYLMQNNYEAVLHELIELFYAYKNETLDRLSDDELIEFMEKAYNGPCGGSLELLAGRELYRLAENMRWGRPADYNDDVPEQEDEDGES